MYDELSFDLYGSAVNLDYNPKPNTIEVIEPIILATDEIEEMIVSSDVN